MSISIPGLLSISQSPFLSDQNVDERRSPGVEVDDMWIYLKKQDEWDNFVNLDPRYLAFLSNLTVEERRSPGNEVVILLDILRKSG